MIKNIFILCCINIFIQNIYAQDSLGYSFKKHKLSINTSPVALLEYANCIQIGTEYRFIKQVGIQAGVGYYNNMIRQSTKNDKISGLRFGGEARLYFDDYRIKHWNFFIGVALYNNISQVSMLQDGLILENGKTKLIQIPISFEHQRRIAEGIVGMQFHLKKRWLIDGHIGVGSIKETVSNLKVPESAGEIYESNWARPYSFPKNNIWRGVNAFDRGGIGFDFGLKIGYILF
jgi:Protein of unknown function (DUF3575)